MLQNKWTKSFVRSLQVCYKLLETLEVFELNLALDKVHELHIE